MDKLLLSTSEAELCSADKPRRLSGEEQPTPDEAVLCSARVSHVLGRSSAARRAAALAEASGAAAKYEGR